MNVRDKWTKQQRRGGVGVKDLPKDILIVDDDQLTAELLQSILQKQGYRVATAADATEGLRLATEVPFWLVFLDVEMPGLSGEAALRSLRQLAPPPEVVMMTAYAEEGRVQGLLQAGAVDFIAKPFSLSDVHRLLEGVQQQRLVAGNEGARERRSGIIGSSPALIACLNTALKTSNLDLPVLLLGENGTGKELFADFIHYNSIRKYASIVKMNCSAVPKDLAENEFFGHEKGAFTGAAQLMRGRIEQADGGTLFLDEIGDIDASLQAKLLRVIETRSFERLGGGKSLPSDFRLITATNHLLEKDVEEGRFRQDLFYRINSIIIRIPPLRERREDIPVLVESFVHLFCQQYMTPVRRLEDEVLKALLAYDWPGNVRELKNTVQLMVSLSQGARITLEALPANISPEAKATNRAEGKTLAQVEEAHICQILAQVGGNRQRAAELLGISPRSLYYKIKEYDIQ
jgi:two-component system response regulator AtoC